LPVAPHIGILDVSTASRFDVDKYACVHAHAIMLATLT